MLEFLNNKDEQRVGDHLRNGIKPDAKLSFISAYFSLFAFEKLKNELTDAQALRFIFSEPQFTRRYHQDKEPKEFKIDRLKHESALMGMGYELSIQNGLNQRAIARECAQWIREKAIFKAPVRSQVIQTMAQYLVANPDGTCETYMGQCDFSGPGLGYGNRDSYMSVQKSGDMPTLLDDMLSQFDAIWDDTTRIKDVTEELITQIETLHRENSPEFIYYLTLYHIFKDYIEEQDDYLEGHLDSLRKTKLWDMLYTFQRDGVIAAIGKLEKYQGCIIADSVGLGKTFEALAVIRYYELRNRNVLVLCPKRLGENWEVYTRNDVQNTLSEERFGYDVMYHTDLSRRRGKTDTGLNLQTLNWGNYDLVVIDESHNFRTGKYAEENGLSRYQKLMEDIIKAGTRTKVLMLSATPVNNKMTDIRNQIRLIAEDDDEYLAATLGIASIDQVTKVAQARFNMWSELPQSTRTVDQFIELLNEEYFTLLDALTIARSRKHIQKYYAADDIGEFPSRLAPINQRSKIDTLDQLPSFAEVNEWIAQLNLSVHSPSKYVMPNKRHLYPELFEGNLNQVNRETGLINLMRVNLLKRLESSVYSFRLTTERLLAQVDTTIEKLQSERVFTEELLDEADIAQDDFEFQDVVTVGNKGKAQIKVEHLDTVAMLQDLHDDRALLEVLLDTFKPITPERDAKLRDIKQLIQEKIRAPHNLGNRKHIIFTAYADTAEYLYKHIEQWLYEEFGLHSALVTGGGATYTNFPNTTKNFNELLMHFSPISKGRAGTTLDRTDEIDLVIATDCISEGQNLQDCDCLTNYDIHWNPVRIIQRFGRIDRLGSKNKTVQLINLWPDVDLDTYINLENRVRGRMIMLDVAASGDENLLQDSPDEMNDIEFRKKQLQQIQKEVLDLEDVSGGISITDFTFDDFKAELERYVRNNPSLVEGSPIGLHAVAAIPQRLRGELQPGVLFCIRQKDDSKRQKDGNSIFPHYMVYVTQSGNILYKHTNPKHALDVFRALCAGQEEVFKELCQDFNRETKDGLKMQEYSDMLGTVVESILGITREKGIESLFNPGGTNLLGEPIKGSDDFSLTTFLVVR